MGKLLITALLLLAASLIYKIMEELVFFMRNQADKTIKNENDLESATANTYLKLQSFYKTVREPIRYD